MDLDKTRSISDVHLNGKEKKNVLKSKEEEEKKTQNAEGT